MLYPAQLCSCLPSPVVYRYISIARVQCIFGTSKYCCGLVLPQFTDLASLLAFFRIFFRILFDFSFGETGKGLDCAHPFVLNNRASVMQATSKLHHECVWEILVFGYWISYATAASVKHKGLTLELVTHFLLQYVYVFLYKLNIKAQKYISNIGIKSG